MRGKKAGVFLASLALSILLASSTRAQAGSPSGSTADDAEKPFKPYYENELELGSTNQEGGQSTAFFSYTGDFHLDEADNFVGFGVQTFRQKVEGTEASIGSLLLEGGLGVDLFEPSLSVTLGGGDQGWRQVSGDITLGLQFSDVVSMDLDFGGSAGYHLGPASVLILPSTTPPLTGQALIDLVGHNASLGFTFVLWNWWTVSPSFEYVANGTNITYHIKYILGQSDETTMTLGMDFTLFKGFVLDLSPQVGKIYYPAGISYSRETGGLVYNATADSQNFVGATTSVSYSFQ